MFNVEQKFGREVAQKKSDENLGKILRNTDEKVYVMKVVIETYSTGTK